MFNHLRWPFLFICLLSLTSLACRLGEVGTAVSPSELPTLPPPAQETVEAQPISVSTNQSPIPTNTAIPADGLPLMTTKVDLNVRRGPSTQYPIVTALRAGESAAIIGRSPDGYWWKIICPAGYSGECWSSARDQYSTATNAQNVPVAAVPPSPTATFTPTATATATLTPTPTFTASPTPTLPPTMTPTNEPTAYP